MKTAIKYKVLRFILMICVMDFFSLIAKIATKDHSITFFWVSFGLPAVVLLSFYYASKKTGSAVVYAVFEMAAWMAVTFPLIYSLARFVSMFGGIEEWKVSLLLGVISLLMVSFSEFRSEKRALKRSYHPSAKYWKFNLEEGLYNISDKFRWAGGKNENAQSDFGGLIVRLVFPFLPFLGRVLSRRLGSTLREEFTVYTLLLMLIFFLMIAIQSAADLHEIWEVERKTGRRLMLAVDETGLDIPRSA